MYIYLRIFSNMSSLKSEYKDIIDDSNLIFSKKKYGGEGSNRKINTSFRLFLSWLGDERDIINMRLVCKDWKDCLKIQKLSHLTFYLKNDKNVVHWRESFSCATSAKLGEGVTDACFPYLKGVLKLDMSWCRKITDASFIHLNGIKELNICGTKVTDSAFEHLSGIHTLNMNWCNKVTDSAFVYLKGVKELYMVGCTKVTESAFKNLSGILILDMSGYNKVTDVIFEYLNGIHTLTIAGCDKITGAGFEHLSGIHTLRMNSCFKISDIAFEHLSGIHTLNISKCILRLLMRHLNICLVFRHWIWNIVLK